MELKYWIGFSVLLILTTVSAQDESIFDPVEEQPCPNFQLKCPTCGPDEMCVYPDSGGCIGAGIPVCKPIQACSEIACLARREQCPQECPFSCQYEGSPCCPFNGAATCAPSCQTFVRCKMTPCPDECPDSCFYPNADECCPNSGGPVCDNPNAPVATITQVISKPRSSDQAHKDGDIHDYENNAPIYYDSGFFPGYAYDVNNQAYNEEDENYRVQHVGGRRNYHNHGDEDDEDNEFYEGLFVGGVGKKSCPTCTKVVTDTEIKVEFVTTTRSSNDIICPQVIIPCPVACPFNCMYPINEPCPFAEQPWCPSIFDLEECTDSTIYETRGFPFPFFPQTDPFHDVFTSILNDSGSVPTFALATVAPDEPDSFCPLLFKYCPAECPHNCVRPDCDCPFAVDAYCPGNTPTATLSGEDALITPAAKTLAGNRLICPMYLLACPVCPEGYTCSREIIGNCPNTNIPFCVTTETEAASTATLSRASVINRIEQQQITSAPSAASYDAELLELSVSHQATTKKMRRHRKQRLMDIDDAEEDVCVKSGFVRVASRQVFEQIHKNRIGCDGCPVVEWNEECDNFCMYRTEEDCCIKTLCLANN